MRCGLWGVRACVHACVWFGVGGWIELATFVGCAGVTDASPLFGAVVLARPPPNCTYGELVHTLQGARPSPANQ